MSCGLLELKAASPPQGLIATDVFYSFLNAFYILAFTTCCGRDIQCCNYTLGEKVPPFGCSELAWPPPMGKTRVNSHSHKLLWPQGHLLHFLSPAFSQLIIQQILRRLRASGRSFTHLILRRAEAPLLRWAQQEILRLRNISLCFAPCPKSSRFDFLFSLS